MVTFEGTMRHLNATQSPLPFIGFAPAAALLLCSTCSPYPPPPETRETVVLDTIHGVVFEDPYRWLENQNSEETRNWIAAQNAYAEQIVGPSPLRDRIRARLAELMDTGDVGSPHRAGDFEYFTLRRKGQELPVIHRRPAPAEGSEEEIDPTGEYEVVVDPHPMSATHNTRVSIRSLSRDGGLMIYDVRDGGADEVELRIRNLRTGEDLPERYPWALYNDAEFNEDGSGFFYGRRSRRTGPRFYFHRMGTDPAEDEEIFGDGYGPTSFINASRVGDGRYFLFTVQHGWARNEVWLKDRRREQLMPIVVDTEAHFDARYSDGEILLRTDLDAPNYRVVAVNPARAEQNRWREIIPESEDVLQSYTTIDDRYYVTYLHNVSTKIRVFEKDGTPAGEIAVPEHHTASIRGGDDGKATLRLTSLIAPQTEYELDLETGERLVSDEPDVEFATDGYVLNQVWYKSKDGTSVPMFVAHSSGIELTGDRPTLLYGYGGFMSSQTSRFSSVAAVWLEEGGVYAMANLRGGTEFGERWHRDGMLENKQNVFDDFIAAAEWLIENGYTNPDRLAIRGASNGGLLVAAALTQRPELFRAMLCAFPDLDMIRFYTFTETNNMPALLEYGDASDPEQFEYLRAYSTYQAVREGVRYPAVMLTSGDLDTRVPPLQARKMTARLQNATRSGLPVILHYDPKQGHAANRGRPMSRVIDDTAMELAFLLTQLGVPAGN
jgi:prolyl oligopeptidase